ncbi:Uncharacterized outer-membrane protein y4mB [Sterolibacterium denitrificans]|uniref:Uncharacterized outer-membrane protein y4mB n=1 Tax=Sterolibacterium denitrificans TaxID=157592 RepID=A0A7Z7MVI5_9PROT|nr:OmpW family outer membrane protein [Sterolibacterium denitrificans]SMB27623.1 Uncharacterized outer-membrane protein y4mB [Sterolibacterium denitrificans]
MKQHLALATLLLAMASPAVHAADGPWMVRVRAVNLDMANDSASIPALGVPSDAIQASSKVIPEVDISYFMTQNIAAELILTYPQKHDVNVTASALGPFKAGSFKHLPPTLLLQYHFMPDAAFGPYVGAGINYTRVSGVNLAVPGVTGLHLDRDSVGAALQIGFDFKLSDNMYLNVDLKKIYIQSDIRTDAGVKVSEVKLDPLAIGVGIGWRF